MAWVASRNKWVSREEPTFLSSQWVSLAEAEVGLEQV